jgi:trehalose 6-phosphate phosphatase
MEIPIPLANLLDQLDRVIPLVRAGRLGLLVDFDGTISPIVPMPPEANISARAAESLRRLVPNIELVSVISGRAAQEVQEKVGLEGVAYVGNHGFEYLDGDRLRVAPGFDRHRDKVKQLFDTLRASVQIPGLLWLDKHYSLSVHYRLAKDPSEARRVLAGALESAPGMDEVEVVWGKMVMEIRAAMGVDKGYAIRRLVDEHRLESAIVLGDDTTDIEAFAALGELRVQGILQGAAVAVVHEDTPDGLVRGADYLLNGIEGVEAFLEWLAATA